MRLNGTLALALTRKSTFEMRLAYQEATQSVQGLGRIVATADTNADVQG